jgi:hypothetical protein
MDNLLLQVAIDNARPAYAPERQGEPARNLPGFSKSWLMRNRD